MHFSTVITMWSLLTVPLAWSYPQSEEKGTLITSTPTTTFNTKMTTTRHPSTTTPAGVNLCDPSQCYKPTVTSKPRFFELTHTACGQLPVVGFYEVRKSTNFTYSVPACEAIQKCTDFAASQGQVDFLLFARAVSDTELHWFCNGGRYDRNALYSQQGYSGQAYQYNGNIAG